jgi:ABC-2 type transport system ATP-binding protein
MNEVEELCNRAAFLHHGKILNIGTIKQLKKLVKHQIVTIHIYPSTKNVGKILKQLPVEVVEHTGDTIVLNIANVNKKLHNVLHPLLKSGIIIKDMHIDKPSLEDVFINIART